MSRALSLRASVTAVALTAFAVVVLVAPLPRVSDRVIYAVVIADLVAVGLIAREWRALWAAVALATCLCVVWYVQFFAADNPDDGLLDGLILALLALAVAGAAIAAGVLVGRLLR
jgi:hypothetical protein